ncbi:MAG: GIY-YIG nuclease family protein [Blastomonas fulva]|uniref:GIY-YIG nuclease family protein n=1 Tax=Blastomonas fulva TaxID=1550728 RepID=UPI00268D8A04
MREGYVYIMANRRKGTLYIGVTNDLVRRADEHRNGQIDGFTKRHGCTRLGWFEAFEDLHEARLVEAQMKKWKRAWKVRVIEELNKDWDDLWWQLGL